MEYKPRGSVVVLVLWLIFFWPIGIGYALIRNWETNVVNEYCDPMQNQKQYNHHSTSEEEHLKNAFVNEVITASEYEEKLKELQSKEKQNKNK